MGYPSTLLARMKRNRKRRGPMLINFLIGFVIAWIYGVYLYLTNPRVVLLIVPFSSVVACAINDWGFNYNFWDFTPILNEQSYSAISFNLGAFAIMPTGFIHIIQKRKDHHFKYFLGLVLLMTAIELGFVISGKVIYNNGWNIFWTFVSYLFSNSLIYGYYRLLKRQRMI